MAFDRTADCFRRYGFLAADLDHLGRLVPYVHPDLEGDDTAAAAHWRRLYCGTIGAEFAHVADPERSAWVAARMEAAAPAPDRAFLVRRLAEAELLERFLHQRYVGSKRYSLEGAVGLVPLLDGVLAAAARQGVDKVLVAMSHRGRLTVMTRVIGTPASKLFAGYEDFEPRSVLGGGDVKYHLGATGTYVTPSGSGLDMHLVSNPSHLEAVDPVLQGRVRAHQERIGAGGTQRVLGITIHGDAAFAGQGIVAETLNMADLPGYCVGGTIHIIVNNLIGFTAEPRVLHSSRYASDVAKRLAVPILHVNGEDPEAVHRVGAMALDFRAAFATDIVVDLIGYRRYGHSEVDDPTATQPLLYRRIEARPMLWQSYAEACGLDGAARQAIEDDVVAHLAVEQDAGRAIQKKPVFRQLPAYWSAYVGGFHQPEYDVDTTITAERIAVIDAALGRTPAGFHVHPKLAKLVEQRHEMLRGTRPLDWAAAEAVAFGSLLQEGVSVRLTGQDSRRGTFNQRHAVLIDHETGAEHTPLRGLESHGAHFGIYDSPLSEAAVLGFEYGFSRDAPDALVCWEAQFGDFANGAQVILDNFASAGEDKWDLLTGLVILLPHGYEGQGPEHSSARLERMLQSCADDNMQVCQPTSAAQYFHLLRRQVLRRWRKPLVVLTPKGALRAPAASSPLGHLTSGRFQPILPDLDAANATRVLFCSGKIAHELRAERARRRQEHVAIVAVEQIYPFPEAEIDAELRRHSGAEAVVWVQEEPANMGGLTFVRPLLQHIAGDRPVTSVKRHASASPATGSPKAHALEQSALLELAFAQFA
jgi:2-oxoglutarate dehydrogenase E1 component